MTTERLNKHLDKKGMSLLLNYTLATKDKLVNLRCNSAIYEAFEKCCKAQGYTVSEALRGFMASTILGASVDVTNSESVNNFTRDLMELYESGVLK